MRSASGAAGRDDDERGRHRQRGQAGIERGVAPDELQVEREQEEEPEHHEERHRDDRAADAEPAIGEEPERQHRVGGHPFPSDEAGEEDRGRDERRQHHTVAPTALGPSMMP
jgi:hypothetical protein